MYTLRPAFACSISSSPRDVTSRHRPTAGARGRPRDLRPRGRPRAGGRTVSGGDSLGGTESRPQRVHHRPSCPGSSGLQDRESHRIGLRREMLDGAGIRRFDHAPRRHGRRPSKTTSTRDSTTSSRRETHGHLFRPGTRGAAEPPPAAGVFGIELPPVRHPGALGQRHRPDDRRCSPGTPAFSFEFALGGPRPR